MTPGRRWAAWLGIGLGIEGWAYYRGEAEGTLTCVIRALLGLDPRKPYASIGKAGLVAFCGWTLVHLSSGRYGIPVRRIG